MRVALKLTIALTVPMLLVLVIGAAIRVDREAEFFQTDMERDGRLLALILVEAIADAYETGGKPAVDELIRDADAAEPEMIIQLLPAGAAELSNGAQPNAEPTVEVAQEGGELIIRTPELEHGLGDLVLRRSLAASAGYRARATRDVAVSTAIVLIFSALVAVGMGWTVVGRRVSGLVNTARRIGAGERKLPAEPSGLDELAQLGVELRRMAGRLEQADEKAVEEARERDLLVQRLRHADRLATIGTLMSRVAHEMGTPLNVIGARADLIDAATPEDADTRRHAQIIANQSARIAATIRRLLDFARVKPSTARFDCRTTVLETAAMLQTVAGANGVVIATNLGTQSMEIVGDASQIGQALTNLIVNAIHAQRDGEVRVSVDRERRRSPTTEEEGEFVVVAVEDRGPGIGHEDVDRVFDPFFTTKPAGAGTGLGLPISAEIAREHGGWIHVDSRPRHGTCFRLYLPAAPTGSA